VEFLSAGNEAESGEPDLRNRNQKKPKRAGPLLIPSGRGPGANTERVGLNP